jgi:hypothetical protein
MENAEPTPAPALKNWKIVGALALLVVLLAILFFGPSLSDSTPAEPEVRTPSMENVPPPGSKQLTIEVQPESEGTPQQTQETQ